MASTIIIYGGYGGVGTAAARHLRARGYALHLVGRDAAKLTAAAAEFDAGSTVGDVCDPDLFTRVAEAAGDDVSGLVYAIGTITLRSLQRLTETEYLNDFRINAMGAALAVRAALPALRKAAGGASVVLFSSVAAGRGFPMHASIGMAKGAVSGLTVSLASELAPRIRVNAIAPSLTQTPLSRSILANPKMADAIAGQHALKRLGTPDDIAAMAAFLVSPDAAWITGQIIGVDGGRETVPATP